MFTTCFLLLLAQQSSFTLAASSIVTLEVTENPCEGSQTCVPRAGCSSYNESIARMRILPVGSLERTELIGQLQKLICNKEKIGVCCLVEVEDANSNGMLEVTENPCEGSHTCIPRERCSSYNESITRLRILSVGSLEHTELIGQLMKLICNKEKRAVCCLAENEEQQSVSQLKPIEDDNEELENEEEMGLDLELYPPPLLSEPRPRLAPNAAKCCRDCRWNIRRGKCVAKVGRRCCPCSEDCERRIDDSNWKEGLVGQREISQSKIYNTLSSEIAALAVRIAKERIVDQRKETEKEDRE